MRKIWLVFFALAVACLTIGFSGQRTFIYVGVAFLIIALLRGIPRRT